MAQKPLGRSGPGGTDSEALQGWILEFGEDITRLSTIVETFFDWLANGSPLLAAYHTFMSGRIIALDKQPGVRLVGVGETCWRILTKITLKTQDRKQPWRVRMTSCVPVSRRELTARSMGFKLYGTKTCIRRNGILCL